MPTYMPTFGGSGIGGGRTPVFGGGGAFGGTQQDVLGGPSFTRTPSVYENFKLDEFDQNGPKMALETELKAWLEQMQRGWAVEDRDLGFQHDFDTKKQSGAYDLLGNILGKGYIDQETRGEARSNYDGVLGDYRAGMNKALGFADTGGYGDDWPALLEMLSGFGGGASSASGGVDWNRVDPKYNEQSDALKTIRDRGKYTDQEFADTIANTKAQQAAQSRASAAATFNKAGGQNQSPAMAAAILARGDRNEGEAAAGARTGMTREQADSRVEGAGLLNQLLGQYMGLTGQDASIKADVSKYNAGNELDMAQLIAGLFSGKADNRLQSMSAINALLGQGKGIADSLSEIDLRQMPDFVKQMFDAQQGVIARPGGGKTRIPLPGGGWRETRVLSEGQPIGGNGGRSGAPVFR